MRIRVHTEAGTTLPRSQGRAGRGANGVGVLRVRLVVLLSVAPHNRQWPEVYDLCHTFLHVERVKEPTAMRESRAILAWP